ERIGVRLLRRFADHVERHVQLDLPGPGFCVQDEFRVGVGATEQAVSTSAARGGRQSRRSFTPRGLLVQLSSYRAARRFQSCSIDLCGLDLCGFGACGFGTCGFDLRGFDLCGFDLCGFDLCGFDLCGFDLCGFDLCGFDLCGFDLCGFDLCGFDLCSLNRCGFALCGLLPCRLLQFCRLACGLLASGREPRALGPRRYLMGSVLPRSFQSLL